MKNVLIDTSVWRKHFSGKLSAQHAGWMSTLLEDDEVTVLLHPWVLGELVLGGLSTKEENLLGLLPSATEVAPNEVVGFVRWRQLSRRGVGWVDVQLLASSLLHSARLLTADVNLHGIARELSIQYDGR